MLASSLLSGIRRRGGTAELVERDLRRSYCTTCRAPLTKHNVLNMSGPDYIAWLSDDDSPCTADEHTPAIEYEVAGELNGYDVHAYCQADYRTGKQSFGHFTARSIAQRGHHDPFSDYNPGGYTFLSRVKDLDWCCPPPRVDTVTVNPSDTVTV